MNRDKCQPQLFQKPLCDRCERLIALPRYVQFRFQRRWQRAEGKSAAFGRVDQVIKGEKISESFSYENRSVVCQTEGTFQSQAVKGSALTDMKFEKR